MEAGPDGSGPQHSVEAGEGELPGSLEVEAPRGRTLYLWSEGEGEGEGELQEEGVGGVLKWTLIVRNECTGTPSSDLRNWCRCSQGCLKLKEKRSQ